MSKVWHNDGAVAPNKVGRLLADGDKKTEYDRRRERGAYNPISASQKNMLVYNALIEPSTRSTRPPQTCKDPFILAHVSRCFKQR
jgi:hypothetical protein